MITWFLRSLSHNWDLLWQMVVSDLRGRYVGSSLGLFWSVIHPLVMILIFTIVFSRVMGARLPGASDTYAYGIYLCAGLLPWIAFQDLVARTTTIFLDNANLVRKVAFPKSVLYGFAVVSGGVNAGLAIGAFMVVLLVTGHFLHVTFLLWLPFVALQLTFGLGIGIIASVLHVFLRDTSQLVTVLLQVWFWATPIVYVDTILPEWLQRLERLNPLFLFSATHRMIVLDGQIPTLRRTAALLLVTGLVVALGGLMYRRFRAEILDEL